MMTKRIQSVDHSSDAVVSSVSQPEPALQCGRGRILPKLKGAQTKTLLLFLHEFLPKHAASLPQGADMMVASGFLVGHMDVLSRAPHAWSPRDREDHRERS